MITASLGKREGRMNSPQSSLAVSNAFMCTKLYTGVLVKLTLRTSGRAPVNKIVAKN